MLTPLILLTIPAYALADRWSGGGLGWQYASKDHGGPLGGRPLWYVAPLLLAVGWLAGDLLGLGVAFAWIVQRSLGFPDGTLDGRNLPLTFARHAIPLAGLAIALPILGHTWLPALPLVFYAAAATALSVELQTNAEANATVEFARGAFWGVACAAAQLLFHLETLP